MLEVTTDSIKPHPNLQRATIIKYKPQYPYKHEPHNNMAIILAYTPHVCWLIPEDIKYSIKFKHLLHHLFKFL